MKKISNYILLLLPLALGLVASLMIFLPTLIYSDTDSVFTGVETVFGTDSNLAFSEVGKLNLFSRNVPLDYLDYFPSSSKETFFMVSLPPERYCLSYYQLCSLCHDT